MNQIQKHIQAVFPFLLGACGLVYCPGLVLWWVIWQLMPIVSSMLGGL